MFEALPTDLAKVISSQAVLTEEHIRWMLLDLLKVLKFLHSAHVVHRDLKPANLLLQLDPLTLKVHIAVRWRAHLARMLVLALPRRQHIR